MMYLSRLSLRRDRDVAALRQLIDPATRAAPIVDAVEQGRRTDAHHRLVWSAFAGQDFDPNERPFLWRADGQGRFMVLSHARPESGGLFDLPEIKEFAPVLAAGDRLHFALRVNATRAVRSDAGNLSTGGKPKRRKNDIVMAMLKDVPKGEARRSARMPMALKAADAWMRKQGEAHGFAPAGKEWLTVEDYSVLALPGAETRKGQPQFGVLNLSGTLEVQDPQALLDRIARGFGRAKAFGCGLMLIRRA